VKPGDLIIFWEGADVVVGLVIERDYNDDSEPAVLVQLMDEPDRIPLHYYDREVSEWVGEGTVTVQSAT